MEAQLLRDMIADRDKSIEKIRSKCKEQIDRELELRNALEAVQGQRKSQSNEITRERTGLLHSRSTAMEHLTALQSDFVRQSDSLHSYCKIPNDAQMKDANFIMRLQAQLCKAMHSMAITEHEMELEKLHTDSMISHQTKISHTCREEMTQSELFHMNELLKMDVQRRDAEHLLKQKLDGILEERKILEQQIAENEDDSETTVEEDLDDEERAAKDEMMRILTERKAEIAKLESKLEEREETIAEMEEEMEDEDFDMEDLARARARVAAVLSEDGGVDEEEESDEEASDEDEESEEEEEDDEPVETPIITNAVDEEETAKQVDNGDTPSSENGELQTKEEDETLATEGSPEEDSDAPQN